MPAAEELVAHNRTVEEVCEAIGADKLIYQDVSDLIASTHEGNKDISEFEVSVFTGEYITGDVDENYLAALNGARSDDAKTARDDDPGVRLVAL